MEHNHPMNARHVGLLAALVLAACGGQTATTTSSDNDIDASHDLQDSGVFLDARLDGDGPAECTWQYGSLPPVSCPADGKTVCPFGDGCNTCRCFPGSGLGVIGSCTTVPCPAHDQ
jgi:hypothetical protein